MLDHVAGLVPAGRAALAMRQADHAQARIEKAIGTIDDFDGHGTFLLNQARDIDLAACRTARPEPVAQVRDLYAREVEGEWDSFDGAAELYAEVLGEAGLAEYRRLAVDAWAKIPPLVAGRHATDDFSSDRRRLARILDVSAERDGDIDARIALRAHDLSPPWRYLELARRRAHKREELLVATERDLGAIRNRVQRARAPLQGKAEIGLKVGEGLHRHKMAIYVSSGSLCYTAISAAATRRSSVSSTL